MWNDRGEVPRKILNGRTYPMTQPISYLRLSSPGNPKYAPIISEVAALVGRGPIPIHVSVDSNKISIPHSGFLLTIIPTPPAQPVNVGIWAILDIEGFSRTLTFSLLSGACSLII